MVRASAESLGIMALLEDFGKKAKIQFYVNASAALGVAQRHGIGQIRHLQTNCLWVQEKAVTQAIEYIKVHGSLNPADINTKNVSRELIDKHVAAMCCCFGDGRAAIAVQLHDVRRRQRQSKAEQRRLRHTACSMKALEGMVRCGLAREATPGDMTEAWVDRLISVMERDLRKSLLSFRREGNKIAERQLQWLQEKAHHSRLVDQLLRLRMSGIEDPSNYDC